MYRSETLLHAYDSEPVRRCTSEALLHAHDSEPVLAETHDTVSVGLVTCSDLPEPSETMYFS